MINCCEGYLTLGKAEQIICQALCSVLVGDAGAFCILYGIL